ncbi:MAG: Hsp20/alpha crystallin family protein [Myxococcales bacterium]|nr:Hsp20/alpha crystallin family protein [Myxococcales bacterium]
MLTRYNPFFSTFDRFFEHTNGRSEAVFTPAVDLLEKEDHFLLVADLPGVKQDAIELVVKDGTLTLTGKREEASEQEREGMIYRERRAGSFTRTVKLGDAIDVNAIEAKYDAGVLTVTLPKRAEVKPRQIKINN